MTLSEIRDAVLKPVDMQDESFMPDAETNSNINKGIKQAEAEIVGIYEDYLVDTYALPLISGQRIYELPSDIFAAKIRNIIYDNGSEKYTVQRIKDINIIPFIDINDEYRYRILNPGDRTIGTVSSYTAGTKTVVFSSNHNLRVGDKINIYSSASVLRDYDTVASVVNETTITLTDGVTGTIATDVAKKHSSLKIDLLPSSRENSSNNIFITYVRRAKQLVNDTDVCDIPEFENFVILYARFECLKKEIGNPLLNHTKQELEQERALMINTLTQMVPDGDNEIEPDTRFYDDFYYEGDF